MATTTALMPYDGFTSNANVQAWVGGFINSMVNVTGWVQSADTGQTPVSGFVTANTQDTPQGYQIYTFTDGLSSTYPIYMKFEFGSGNSQGGSCPGMWVTIGTGSNGAGTLTGQVSQRIQVSDTSGNLGNSLYTSYFSGNNNRFVCGLWDAAGTTGSAANIPYIISIERSKDSSGNDNTDGVMFYTASRRSGSYQQFIPFTGTIVSAIPFWMGAFQANQSMAVNSLIGITFPTPFNAAPYNSGYNLAVSNGTDIPIYNQVTGTLYGNSHNYLQLQYNNSAQIFPWIRGDSVIGGSVAPFSSNQQYSIPLHPLIRYD